MKQAHQASIEDRICIEIEAFLTTLFTQTQASRPTPKAKATSMHKKPSSLTTAERQHSAALMRINEVGEICAQALYRSQALLTQNPEHKRWLEEACQEELDHLAWCQQRIIALNGRSSMFNPIWYTGAYLLGLIAGLMPSAVGLGFIIETEAQVEKHLHKHLENIAKKDVESRAIIDQMAKEEAAHAGEAESRGGKRLPMWTRQCMKAMAKIMTTVAYHY